MKKVLKKAKRIMLFIVFAMVAVSLISCKKKRVDNDQDEPDVDPVKAEISLTLSADTIKDDETVNVTVSLTNDSANKGYTVSVSEPTLIKVQNNVLSIIGSAKIDKMVTVTATYNGDESINAKKTIKYLAPVVEGQVGELTTSMLVNLGNANVTVNGEVTDVYTDYKQSINSSEQTYYTEIKMSDGAWCGSWYYKGNSQNIIQDNYRKGTTDGVSDQHGNTGHTLEKIHINKNNEVVRDTVKDYMSVPAVWEAQHLWNHLGNLNITKFTYDAENEVYEYNIDQTDKDDLYLMTYLAYSLTPMVSDTFVKLYLRVEDGEITELIAQTEILLYGNNTEEDPDAMSYTVFKATFADFGDTTIPEPTPYAAPENVSILEQALNFMKTCRNYSFRAADTTTYAPTIDSSEYEIESTTGKVVRTSKTVQNNTSSVGTVGLYGQITSDAVLFANTIKYDYTMDGNNYRTEYTGYKKIDDNTFDEFAYNTKTQAMYGTKKYYGKIEDVLPKFEFSANLFKYSGLQTNDHGVKLHTFVLQEGAVTRDIAMETSCYRYAKDGEESTNNRLTIVVTDSGQLYSITYPYSLVSGTYLGYVTTTYGNYNETELPEDLFVNYEPRVLRTSWDQYTTKYYSPTFSTQDSKEEATSVVLNAVFGDAASYMPSPDVFMNIVGDNIFGPFYNWKVVGTDADGKDINHGYISINVTSSEFDENQKITNYEELMEEFKTALEKCGFKLSQANTDTTGGPTGQGNRYVTFIKEDIQIVIENNGTKYISIYFYQTGDWTLNKN